MWRAWSRISGLTVSVYVLWGVGVITWPAAHETEKQTQAVYSRGHSQGDRREVVCLYNVSVEECQHVCCGVCKCGVQRQNYDFLSGFMYVLDLRAPCTHRYL